MNDDDRAYYDYLLEREAPRIPQDVEPVVAGSVRPGAMAGEISAIPRQPAVGAIADFVREIREFADQYEVKDWVPLLGGTSLGDLFIGKSPEEIENLAYGNLPMVVPQQSNIPVMKPGRKQSVSDTVFLGLDVAPLATAAAKTTARVAKRAGKKAVIGAGAAAPAAAETENK